MTVRRGAIAWASMLACSLAPARGAAQEDTRAAAARAFDEGQASVRRSDFEAALASFQRAFALQPEDRVRFNIALTLERLRRFREAALEFDQAATSSLPDDARRQARESAARARGELGTVVVD